MRIVEVKKGDTLAALAIKHRTTVESLVLLNGVCVAMPGERLLTDQMHGRIYVVKPFDTPEKIARKMLVPTNKVNAALLESGIDNTLFLGKIIYL